MRLGRLLGRTRTARACVDLSDGLADAVGQLAEASGVGAAVDAGGRAPGAGRAALVRGSTGAIRSKPAWRARTTSCCSPRPPAPGGGWPLCGAWPGVCRSPASASSPASPASCCGAAARTPRCRAATSTSARHRLRTPEGRARPGRRARPPPGRGTATGTACGTGRAAPGGRGAGPDSRSSPLWNTRMRSMSRTVDRRCAMASVVRPAMRRCRASRDQRLGGGVHVGRRLVEHQHLRVERQGAGEREQLLLARRERGAPLRHLGVEPARQAVDERARVRGVGSGAHRRVAARGRAESYVVADGAREQEHVLQHQAEAAPQRVQRNLADVDAVDGDAPRG